MPGIDISAGFPGEKVLTALVEAISQRHSEMSQVNRDRSDDLLLRIGEHIGRKLGLYPDVPQKPEPQT